MWRGRRHHRQAGGGSRALQRRGALLVARAQLAAAPLTMADAGQRAGGEGRRQRGGEDEARARRLRTKSTSAADRGDVAADHAERLGERALRSTSTWSSTPSRSATPAPRCAVHADGMDLVEIGEGAVAVRRRRRSRRSARCRRPSNRPIRTRRASGVAGSAAASSSLEMRRGRCGGRSASRRRQWRMPAIIEAWLQRVGKDDRSPAACAPSV